MLSECSHGARARAGCAAGEAGVCWSSWRARERERERARAKAGAQKAVPVVGAAMEFCRQTCMWGNQQRAVFVHGKRRVDRAGRYQAAARKAKGQLCIWREKMRALEGEGRKGYFQREAPIITKKRPGQSPQQESEAITCPRRAVPYGGGAAAP